MDAVRRARALVLLLPAWLIALSAAWWASHTGFSGLAVLGVRIPALATRSDHSVAAQPAGRVGGAQAGRLLERAVKRSIVRSRA